MSKTLITTATPQVVDARGVSAARRNGGNDNPNGADVHVARISRGIRLPEATWSFLGNMAELKGVSVARVIEGLVDDWREDVLG